MCKARKVSCFGLNEKGSSFYIILPHYQQRIRVNNVDTCYYWYIESSMTLGQNKQKILGSSLVLA